MINSSYKLVGVMALVVASLLMATNYSIAQKRIALVIGNSDYKLISELNNPKNDAELMTQTLIDVGFDVIYEPNVDLRGMGRAMRKFGKALRAAGKDAVGLFYYAGHGMQSRGENYLIPLGAEVETEEDLAIEAINASQMLRQMESAGNALNLIILDACRNNPFKSSFRSASRGFTRVVAPSGSLVAFSAAPGQVAADGSGRHSPYTQALVKHIKQPGLSVEQMFKRVRISVKTNSGNNQTPWEESSLLGDFYFVPKADNPVPRAEAPVISKGAIELSFWNSVRDSHDIPSLEEFLKQFPDSVFSNLARIKLANLRKTDLVNKPVTTGPAQNPVKKPDTKVAVGTFPKLNSGSDNLSRSYDLKLATSFPKGFAVLGQSATSFVEALQDRFEEKVKIKLFAAGEFVSSFEVFDAVANGKIDMGWSTMYYWSSKEPALSLLTRIPFGSNALQHANWRSRSDVRQLVDDITSDYGLDGIVTIPCAATTAEGDLWSIRPIHSSKDLKGMKIRTNSDQGSLMQKLGASVIRLPGGQVYMALQTGVIDAANWVTPQLDSMMSFHELSKYYYYPSKTEPGIVLDLMINKTLWEEMPVALQQGIEQVCRKNIDIVYSGSEKADRKALVKFRDEGVQIQPLPDEVQRSLNNAWLELVKENSAKSLNYARLYKLAPQSQ